MRGSVYLWGGFFFSFDINSTSGVMLDIAINVECVIKRRGNYSSSNDNKNYYYYYYDDDGNSNKNSNNYNYNYSYSNYYD